MFDLNEAGREAKKMARYAARLSTREKNDALLACASALEARIDYILEENRKDMISADPSRAAFNDRLSLTAARIEGMAQGLRKVAALDDPVGEVLRVTTRPNGLQIGEKRTPLGVVGMIYEARPNVTADSFGLCFKSGNSSILRGGTEALCSNTAIVEVIHYALEDLGHPPALTQLITDTSRETARAFMRLNEYVDVLIPRGGAGLINSVVENSTIPVVETGTGNCHVFVDATADIKMALDIVVNAKTSRPSVCNACEKLLVHKTLADKFIPLVCEALADRNVEIRGDDTVRGLYAGALAAAEEDWYLEYCDLIIGVKAVEDINEAIEHINQYSSGHSEAIVTESYTNANRFLDEVDSAAVYVNASTRFTDGEEFGLGAEIGISTQKLHARGPMGLSALTTTKFIIFGNGQIR
uniref:Gamma-glutamyl phosphate reductase n=1 Tax=uncultured bacterium contig00025 TaxID=1181514 RepID=A0A806KFL0_9BACT|nr:gamma-glutamyl phosphate reductase [uncultured bacterium contig00025]